MDPSSKLSALRASALTGVLLLAGCPPPRNQPRPAPPAPPPPVSLTLSPIRVSRAPWAQSATAPAATPPRGGRRGLTLDLAQPVLASANDAVRACYKGLLVITPQAQGTMTVLMRVNPDGAVSDVEHIGQPDPSLLLMMPCVSAAVRSRRFPPLRSPALASYTFVFRSGEVGGPTPQGGFASTAAPRPGELQVPNTEPITVRPWRPALVPNTNPVHTLTRDMVNESTPDVTSMLDTCYSAALVMVDSLSGEFTMRFAVEPSGRVHDVEVNDNGALAGPLRQCISELGRRVLFHSSTGGATVSIPISLNIDGEAAPSTGTTPATPGAAPTAPTTGAPTSGTLPVAGGR